MLAAHNETDSFRDVARLDDEELITTLRHLLAKERRLSARLLVHLAEVDVRGLYRQHAYGSMFDYCVHALHLSEAEAYLRIRAARLIRKFPRVLQMMASGELHLSAVKLLAPVLTAENCDELLVLARCKSKHELELFLAQRFQKPDVPSLIRKLPQNGLVPEPVGVSTQSLLADCAELPSASSPKAPAQQDERPVQAGPSPLTAPAVQLCPEPGLQLEPRPSARPLLSPLGPSRYKLQLTANQQLHDKLRQAQDLLRHELPDGDIGQVLERALDLLIAERMKRRFGKTSKPRRQQTAPAPTPGSRHIPHAVRREVVERDGARCTFISDEGKRCEQLGRLQLHHEAPYGRGGPATVSNIRVLCRAHNQLLAEQDYGRDFVQQRIEQARSRRRAQRLDALESLDPSH